jgi:hypothetical protein
MSWILNMMILSGPLKNGIRKSWQRSLLTFMNRVISTKVSMKVGTAPPAKPTGQKAQLVECKCPDCGREVELIAEEAYFSGCLSMPIA